MILHLVPLKKVIPSAFSIQTVSDAIDNQFLQLLEHQYYIINRLLHLPQAILSILLMFRALRFTDYLCLYEVFHRVVEQIGYSST